MLQKLIQLQFNIRYITVRRKKGYGLIHQIVGTIKTLNTNMRMTMTKTILLIEMMLKIKPTVWIFLDFRCCCMVKMRLNMFPETPANAITTNTRTCPATVMML